MAGRFRLRVCVGGASGPSGPSVVQITRSPSCARRTAASRYDRRRAMRKASEITSLAGLDADAMPAIGGTREILIPHTTIALPLTAARNVLIQSSLAGLQARGYYDRYAKPMRRAVCWRVGVRWAHASVSPVAGCAGRSGRNSELAPRLSELVWRWWAGRRPSVRHEQSRARHR